MTKHHFVPVSILSTFASDQAWRIVNAAPEIRARIVETDKKVMANQQKKRRWPICVYEKNRKRITRMEAKDVCSMPNLYGVLDQNEQLIRALMRYVLEDNPAPTTLDELLRLGERPLDPNMIENTHVRDLDGSFASILPALRTGQQISDIQIDTIRRFITFARFRTPIWQRVHYPVAFEKKQRQLKEIILRSWNESHIRKITNKSLEAINAAFDNNLYQMAIIQASKLESNALSRINAKILVLHRNGPTPFVTCDNPARPYFPDRIRRIGMEAIPGMGNTRSQLTFPIDPNTCLLISGNARYSTFAHEEVNDKQVRKINCALALMADKEIILADPNTNVFENWLDLNNMKPIRRP